VADPALGLKMKLEVDDSSIPADIARAKAKADAAGRGGGGGAAALLGRAGGTSSAADEVEIAKHQEMLAKKAAADDAYYAKVKADALAAAKAKADAEAMTRIGRETGGPTPGEINARTAAYARMDDSLKGVRKRFTDSAQEGMKWLGVAGLIAGTATTFYAIGQAIRVAIIENMQTATERALGFKQALDLSDVQGSLQSYNDELANLESQLAGRMEGNLLGRLSRILKSDESLQNEITQKRKDRDALQQTQDAARRRDERIKEKADAEAKAKEQAETKRRDQIAQRKQEAEDGKRFGEEAFQTEQDNLVNSLDERTRIVAESARKRNELEDKFNALTFQQQDKNQEAYDRARDALILERNRRLREFDQQQVESAQEAAAKVQQAWSNAYRAIREESNRAFATDQAASMVQFAQQMRIEGITASANMNQIVVQGVG
jgi:hypothetical protein